MLLIEGYSGMGKTTYCQKLAYNWSVGIIPLDASFPEVNILLLLKCRDVHMRTANIEEAVDDQLLFYKYRDLSTQMTVVKKSFLF